MKSPVSLLYESDLKIFQEAQALAKAGLSETTGVALRGAASKVLQVQTDLANLKGMILYSLAFSKTSLHKEWQSIVDAHFGENLSFHKIESYANSDPKYSAIQEEISGLEALLSIIEDNLWALRSIIKFYSSSTN